MYNEHLKESAVYVVSLYGMLRKSGILIISYISFNVLLRAYGTAFEMILSKYGVFQEKITVFEEMKSGRDFRVKIND